MGQIKDLQLLQSLVSEYDSIKLSPQLFINIASSKSNYEQLFDMICIKNELSYKDLQLPFIQRLRLDDYSQLEEVMLYCADYSGPNTFIPASLKNIENRESGYFAKLDKAVDELEKYDAVLVLVKKDEEYRIAGLFKPITNNSLHGFFFDRKINNLIDNAIANVVIGNKQQSLIPNFSLSAPVQNEKALFDKYDIDDKTVKLINGLNAYCFDEVKQVKKIHNKFSFDYFNSVFVNKDKDDNNPRIALKSLYTTGIPKHRLFVFGKVFDKKEFKKVEITFEITLGALKKSKGYCLLNEGKKNNSRISNSALYAIIRNKIYWVGVIRGKLDNSKHIHLFNSKDVLKIRAFARKKSGASSTNQNTLKVSLTKNNFIKDQVSNVGIGFHLPFAPQLEFSIGKLLQEASEEVSTKSNKQKSTDSNEIDDPIKTIEFPELGALSI